MQHIINGDDTMKLPGVPFPSRKNRRSSSRSVSPADSSIGASSRRSFADDDSAPARIDGNTILALDPQAGVDKASSFEMTKETDEVTVTTEAAATTEETANEEKDSKEETPNEFIKAFKTFLGESFPTLGKDEEAALKRMNDAVGETVKNIDERVKIIVESEEFKNTKSKVDETVQTTMVKVSEYADQLAIQILDAAAAALEEDDAAPPKDESRNDVGEDAMSVVTEIRAA